MKHALVLRRKARRVRRTQEEIAALLDEYRSSGQTQSAYARSRGLSLSTLTYWLRRSRVEGRPAAPQRLVAVKIADAPGSMAWSPFELGLPGGLRLSIPPDFDADALARLLPLLADRC